MKPFDGVLGSVVAHLMATGNADAEKEAVELLAPPANACVLVIGFGPGVGVQLLARTLSAGRIIGVDPLGAMVRAATRRNARAICEKRVELRKTTADRTGAADASFDGAIAVNSLQLCEPIAATAQELGRVMRPGARLLSLTHDWAMIRHAGSVDAWVEQTSQALQSAGFSDFSSFRAKAEKGRSVALIAQRRD